MVYDVIDVSDSRIDYHIYGGPGDDNITFKNSSTQVIFGDDGDDQITIEGTSSVSGSISGNRHRGDDKIPGEINSLVFKSAIFSSQKNIDIYSFARVDLIEGTQFTLNKDMDLGKYTGFNFDTGSKQEIQLTPVMSIDDTSNLIITQGSHTLTADLNNNGLELGADKAITLANGTLYLGGLVGQTSSSQNFNEGVSSDIDCTTLGAYATYFHESGFYVDTILKYNRFGTDT